MTPIRLAGPWDDGYALDLHTTSADFLGYDEFGHPQYDTHYTELGGLLHRLKYRSDASGLPRLVSAAAEFVRTWKISPEVLVPVPPSRKRTTQLVFDLAQGLAAELNLAVDTQSLTKIRDTPQLKGVDDYSKKHEILAGAFSVQGTALQGRRVLLFDDLFQSGATMAVITNALKDAGAAAVFALTLTRTRSK